MTSIQYKAFRSSAQAPIMIRRFTPNYGLSIHQMWYTLDWETGTELFNYNLNNIEEVDEIISIGLDRNVTAMSIPNRLTETMRCFCLWAI